MDPCGPKDLFTLYRFDSASDTERTVFGASRPGYPSSMVPSETVEDWIGDLRRVGVSRLCCLLDGRQLDYYDDLPGSYRRAFGGQHVLFAPIEDYTLVDPQIFRGSILPFLRDADEAGERVLVHCSGGYGRTGHVLAAWLVAARAYSPCDAVAAVVAHGRSPAEALNGDEAALADFLAQFSP